MQLLLARGAIMLAGNQRVVCLFCCCCLRACCFHVSDVLQCVLQHASILKSFRHCAKKFSRHVLHVVVEGGGCWYLFENGFSEPLDRFVQLDVGVDLQLHCQGLPFAFSGCPSGCSYLISQVSHCL